jgi:hypothetical protein
MKHTHHFIYGLLEHHRAVASLSEWTPRYICNTLVGPDPITDHPTIHKCAQPRLAYYLQRRRMRDLGFFEWSDFTFTYLSGWELQG